MKSIDFYGTVTTAKQVTWRELDSINEKSDWFLCYLGNHPCIDDDMIYALFKDVDEACTHYCVLLTDLE